MFRRLPRPASLEPIRLRMLSLGYLDGGDHATVIALTSRLRREGVSTVVAGLARAFGAANPEGVLVLDADPSGRRVTDLMRVRVTPVRLEDLDLEDFDLPSFVARKEDFGVDTMAISASGRTGLGWEQKAKALLDRLRRSYRVIFVDAGALSGEQAQIWLTYSDHRLLVFDTGVATHEVLERLRRELDQTGITLSGTILNKRVYPVPRILYHMIR
jgi:Mrp family chromosome partitioning ATPase